jgi:ABC-type phosphate transport system substrate-binding protein
VKLTLQQKRTDTNYAERVAEWIDIAAVDDDTEAVEANDDDDAVMIDYAADGIEPAVADVVA